MASTDHRPAGAGMKDVATRAGVAIGTVSNVINRPHLVAEPTRQRVLEAMDELAFVRNESARQLKAGRSRSIGMVVLDVRNPFFTDLARGAETRAADLGMRLLLSDSGELIEREASYIDLFAEQRVRGLLLTPIGDLHDQAMVRRLRRLAARGTSVVLVDRQDPSREFASVSVDDVSGGSMAVTHLVEQGHRSVTFVGGPGNLQQVRDRRAGAETAAAAAGVRLGYQPTARLTFDAGVEAARQLLALPEHDRPEALFAANDVVAVGLLQGLAIGGLRVPHDIALIGYDDIGFARATTVPLTSIRQPADLLGRSAVDLLDLGEEPIDSESRQVIFQPELAVRASSGVDLFERWRRLPRP